MENFKLKTKMKHFKAFKKIDKTIIKFSDIEIKKQSFHQHKSPMLITNIDIKIIVVSNKFSFTKKSF